MNWAGRSRCFFAYEDKIDVFFTLSFPLPDEAICDSPTLSRQLIMCSFIAVLFEQAVADVFGWMALPKIAVEGKDMTVFNCDF